MKPIRKVHGPYISSIDKRQRVVIVYTDGKKTTRQYSRYLMEKHLGRDLDPMQETVDHINGDYLDNRLENLRVLPKSEHARQDRKRVKLIKTVCVLCGKEKFKKVNTVHWAAKRGNAGPFCSHSCAGKYSNAVQFGKRKPLPPQKEIPFEDREYYYVEKS